MMLFAAPRALMSRVAKLTALADKSALAFSQRFLDCARNDKRRQKPAIT